MRGRRLWALGALVALLAAVVLAIVTTVANFPAGLSVLACLLAALIAAAYGVRRRGPTRIAGLAVAALLVAGAVALVILEGSLLGNLLTLALVLASVTAAREAFIPHAKLRPAPAPSHPVLIYNPLSGDGKAKRFGLAGQARSRGIEPIELRRGDDLEQLVRDAVARGADGLAMAGGDGSQAVVARIAAELDLPYACIPSGTRNHFALDLGVDRNDVVGALDAFVDGAGERRVDLAEVNGRVFVNNVSLGLYAEAVQRPGYRGAKLQTLLETVPDSLGPDADPPSLSWDGGDREQSAVAVLVSNNPYRLGRALGSGTRPRLNRGLLGIAALTAARGGGASVRQPLVVRQWAVGEFEMRAGARVPAGIDGEAAELDPPLRFRVHSRVLRVRIAPSHPGASPSALEPDRPSDLIKALYRMAIRGRAPVVR